MQRQDAGLAIEEDEEEGSQPGAAAAVAASQRAAGPVRSLVPPLQLPLVLEATQHQEQAAAPVRPLATRRLGSQDRQADESGEHTV